MLYNSDQPKLGISLVILIILLSCSTENNSMKYPITKKTEVSEVIHGEIVDDPYRWLEDFTSDEVDEWVNKQNNFSDQFLSGNSYKNNISKNLEEIWETDTIGLPFIRGGKTFYYFNNGNLQQNILMMQDCESCEAEILLDPNNFSKDGTISLSSASVSPDGKLLAYAISDGGSDWKTWYVLDIDSKKKLDDVIEWSKFSYATWESDSSGFYYQKYDKPNEALADVNKAPKLYFHSIGVNQDNDDIEYADSTKPDWSWDISVPKKGDFRLLSISEGTDERNLLFIKNKPDESYVPIIDKFKGAFRYLESRDNILWFYTTYKAPKGKVVSLTLLGGNDFLWNDVIPESKETISSVSLVGNKIIINYLKDTLSSIQLFDLSGKYLLNLEIEGRGSVQGFDGNLNDKYTFFEFQNFVSPSKIYRLDLLTLKYELFWQMELPGYEIGELTTSLKFFPSKDGTIIPVHVSHQAGLEISKNTPVLLYGYGGFNISILPSFSKTFYTWMKEGGVLSIVNLRGGAEYGDSWHQDGMLLNKQNVFDDFAYAAKFLHSENIGSSNTTVSLGRSNGGLLVAATMLQNPELFKVAIPQVGVLDMLRFHKFTIGWAWESDYGSPDEEEDFKNLLTYSPYHNIKEGFCYPTTLITTSARDDRVVPAHSYKFAARLQEGQGCTNPILLRVESRAGHGSGTPKDKQIEEIADIFGFALSQIN
ncbi:prolyl oligopeptidase family serine peptidase [Gammaproteobacteria bacterium]|nr:prolyl oligopeptidase family serine peptidase [Gammaproteobacteria bacterium]